MLETHPPFFFKDASCSYARTSCFHHSSDPQRERKGQWRRGTATQSECFLFLQRRPYHGAVQSVTDTFAFCPPKQVPPPIDICCCQTHIIFRHCCTVVYIVGYNNSTSSALRSQSIELIAMAKASRNTGHVPNRQKPD
jgi:hypothetical protein